MGKYRCGRKVAETGVGIEDVLLCVFIALSASSIVCYDFYGIPEEKWGTFLFLSLVFFFLSLVFVGINRKLDSVLNLMLEIFCEEIEEEEEEEF